MEIEVAYAATENYRDDRMGYKIGLIVDHWMATTEEGARRRFQDPSSVVSAHYGVTFDGRVIRYCEDDWTAYHAGDWETNLISIGIEHEAWPADPERGIREQRPTDKLYAASAELHRELADKYGLVLDSASVIPHSWVVPTRCPGTLDLNRIVEEAMSFVTQEAFDAYIADNLNAHTAVREVLASLAAGAARDEARDASMLQEIKNTEIRAVVEAILSVKPEALKPAVQP